MESKLAYSPWDEAYKKWGNIFTREEIDEMTFGEIEELLDPEGDEYDDGFWDKNVK
jgi:hypothetical protein